MISIRTIKTEIRESNEECHLPEAPDSAGYSRFDQIRYVSLGITAGMILTVARVLQPSPRGVGTHEQLGLPVCPFLHLTGIPCPSCGLTTSFAHAARFNFLAALITQPFGLLAFCLTVLSIPILIYLMRRRIPWSAFIYSPIVNRLLYGLTAIYILSWIYKIIVMKSPLL